MGLLEKLLETLPPVESWGREGKVISLGEGEREGEGKKLEREGGSWIPVRAPLENSVRTWGEAPVISPPSWHFFSSSTVSAGTWLPMSLQRAAISAVASGPVIKWRLSLGPCWQIRVSQGNHRFSYTVLPNSQRKGSNGTGPLENCSGRSFLFVQLWLLMVPFYLRCAPLKIMLNTRVQNIPA